MAISLRFFVSGAVPISALTVERRGEDARHAVHRDMLMVPLQPSFPMANHPRCLLESIRIDSLRGRS